MQMLLFQGVEEKQFVFHCYKPTCKYYIMSDTLYFVVHKVVKLCSLTLFVVHFVVKLNFAVFGYFCHSECVKLLV